MKSILVTRPQPAADELAEKLRKEGFSVHAAPLTEYIPLSTDISAVSSCQGIIFTSAEGARVFSRLSPVRDLPVFAVGEATARIARSAGFDQVFAADGDSREMAKLIRRKKSKLRLQKLFHASGEDTAQDLAEFLNPDGIEIERAILYKAKFLDKIPAATAAALRRGEISTITLFSARAGEKLVSILSADDMRGVSPNLTAVCISKRVAASLQSLRWKSVHIAQKPDFESVMDLLRQAASDQKKRGILQKDKRGAMKDKENNPGGDRRQSTDRRQKPPVFDARGHVVSPNYTGPDRRSGIDRRAHRAQQEQKIRREKWNFVDRSLLTVGLICVAVLYIGAFLMAPEFVELRDSADRMEKMEAQMKAMDTRLQQMQQRPHGSFSGALNTTIEQAENAAGVVTSTVGTLSEASGEVIDNGKTLQSIEQLVRVLSTVSKMNGTASGRATLSAAMESLKGIMSAAGSDAASLSAAVAKARKKDPALSSLLGHVDGKDLGAAALLLTLNELRGDIDSQQSFDENLAVLTKFSADDPEMQAAIARLAPYARSGVLSRAGLQAEFKSLAADIVMAKLQGEDLSVREKILQRLSKLVKVRKIDDIEGNSVDAVVARAQLLLNKGDVQGAMKELQSLQGAPAETAKPWMEKAQGHVTADESSGALIGLVMRQMSSGAEDSIGDFFSDILRKMKSPSVPYLSPSMQKGGGAVYPLAPQ